MFVNFAFGCCHIAVGGVLSNTIQIEVDGRKMTVTNNVKALHVLPETDVLQFIVSDLYATVRDKLGDTSGSSALEDNPLKVVVADDSDDDDPTLQAITDTIKAATENKDPLAVHTRQVLCHSSAHSHVVLLCVISHCWPLQTSSQESLPGGVYYARSLQSWVFKYKDGQWRQKLFRVKVKQTRDLHFPLRSITETYVPLGVLYCLHNRSVT